MTEHSDQFLLEIRGLKTYFYTDDGVVKAVDGVDFNVNRGEILGLVGESGCGKSVTALSIMQLIRKPGKIVEGKISFDSVNLRELPLEDIQEIRGNRISMIFQQPQTSLNPVITVGDQLAEVFEIHADLNDEEMWEKSVELLRTVGIADPEQKALAYPHEMSGGQAQRVMIAMGLAMSPELLIADEPTTALDVTIQAQILDLMRDLRNELGTAVILITHDLGVIAEMADWVAVMYAGQIVEQAGVVPLFDNPFHPYTRGLINSIPVLGETKHRLADIDGVVPNLVDLPKGCNFAPRCKAREKYGLSICEEINPDLDEIMPNHTVRCWLYQDTEDHKAPLKP
ncbi:MAG: methionine ABC transporter ATP-binding protein [Chloroflexota bacterium]|nr:MAG: methionine ABC transporter ATP-binding protein [Chloroflexota bacterium]HDD62407.1 ABC transporter ATP-binding protein [Chloroflexota bacterium]